MNWVGPITDDVTLNALFERMRSSNPKAYMTFLLGVRCGMFPKAVTSMHISDVLDKETVCLPRQVKDELVPYDIPEDVREIIRDYVRERFAKGTNYARAFLVPLSFDNPYMKENTVALNRASMVIARNAGIMSFGTATARKTYGWKRYMENRACLEELRELYGLASGSAVLRFLGILPAPGAPREMTPEDNERARRMLLTDDTGAERIEAVISVLRQIGESLYDPASPDSLYGSVDLLLGHMEDIIGRYGM